MIASAVVTAVALLICARFVGHVVAIVLPLLRHRPDRSGDATVLQWHFLVPCLNEGTVIEQTVRELTSRFPAADVWCVDDASVDDTPEILARLAADPRVHTVTRRLPEAQEGKGPALNAGWRAIVSSVPPGTDFHGVIVGLIDADCVLDPRCLDIISGTAFFGDPRVSAVQINVRIVEDRPQGGRRAGHRSRLLSRLQDLEFTAPIAGMQMLRRRLGTAGMGGTGQFTRLAALTAIAEEHGTPWHRSLLEDFELGLHVLLTGGRTEYCHDTWVAQEGPPTLRGLIRQRSRWAQGTIQCSRYLWPVWRSPWISRLGRLEITKFVCGPWLQMFNDIVAVALLATLILKAVAGVDPGFGSIGFGGWWLIPLFVLLGMTRLVAWGPIYRATQARDLSIPQAWALGIASLPFGYVHEIATWWAFARTVRRRDDWKKTPRKGVLPGGPGRPTAAGVAPGGRRPESPTMVPAAPKRDRAI